VVPEDRCDVEVALVDDGSVAFRGVIHTLAQRGGVRFAGAFDGWASIPAVLAGIPNLVVIVDPFGPVTSSVPPPDIGSSAARVLVMSSSERLLDVRAAIQLGYRGYISKGANVAMLVAAINVIGSGGLFFDVDLSRALYPQPAPTTAEPVSDLALSLREREVLEMVARGFTHKQIATRLGLSKSTVDTYVQRIRQKLGATNKAMLTRLALESGVLVGSGVG